MANRVTGLRPPKYGNQIADRVPIVDERFHCELYQKLSTLDPLKVLEYETHTKSVLVKLAPVGCPVIPNNENELRSAIRDVLRILKRLHHMNVVHRDIRWSNIVRLVDGSWMLIDFEEAAPIGSSRTALTIRAPEFEDWKELCNTAGDVWMVGNLFKDLRLGDLSPSAIDFSKKLLHENPVQRPSANFALIKDFFNFWRNN
ncbi:hypothetical protein G9A89_008415 [Geosiphon pyriformis]|nr:hypothetical protein G9A89_008415 [Geosiphon pyriformis]